MSAKVPLAEVVSTVMLPLRVGRTEPGTVMLLNAHGKYACSVQLYQTPRKMGHYDEERRAITAAYLLHAANVLPALVATLEKAETELQFWLEHAREIPAYSEEARMPMSAKTALASLKQIREATLQATSVELPKP